MLGRCWSSPKTGKTTPALASALSFIPAMGRMKRILQILQLNRSSPNLLCPLVGKLRAHLPSVPLQWDMVMQTRYLSRCEDYKLLSRTLWTVLCASEC